MPSIFQRYLSTELGKGSLILFVMANVYNFFNYLFHFLTARMLGPADYGTLVFLMSVIYVFSIPSEAIQTIVARYVSRLNVKKELGKMHYLLSKVIHQSIRLAFVCFIGFLAIALVLSWVLDISYLLFFITGGVLFGIFLIPSVRGVLQGRKQFKALGTNMIIEAISKITISVILILLINFFYGGSSKVPGAITGVLAGIYIAFFLSFISLKDVYRSKKSEMSLEGAYTYTFSVFIAMLAIILVYSVDILLAKLFFPPEIAGQYAVASMIGKMIFFGTNPISKAMFPVSSEKDEIGKITRPFFISSFLVVFSICLIPLAVMLFFPQLLVGILFGKEYLAVAEIVFYIGSALSLLSLTNLVIVYGVSVGRLRWSYLLFGYVVIEIVLLSLFHATLREFSLAFLLSNAIIFISSFLFVRRKNGT